ncbi:hypothetical protein DSO57_1035746 [Entomophthora muscae]|uniref:Uncharacterized protein n=1 Tax=Entomophthora muscae TaxID=34485 RepID=A0ACC2RE92_9FUNG|nr:hypothetical protein DSO57_1035746 [Entomophthora muscae]
MEEFKLDNKEHIDQVSVASATGDDHRTGSSFGAYFNIVCAIAGSGILGLPAAVAKGGWIMLGFFGLVAVVSIFTGRLLVECLYYKPGERLQELPDIGEAAFGKLGRYFTKFFHYTISLSGATIYILLTGTSIFKVLNDYGGVQPLAVRTWIMIAGLIVVVPFSLLKSMKEVALLSVLGVLATVVVVFVVVIWGGINYDPSTVQNDTFVFENLPSALATIAFSYGGNVVYPHVEGSMRHPRSWNRVLTFAIMSITAMYIITGLCGYLYYGRGVSSPILESLPTGTATLIGYVAITAHVLLATPIYLCSFALEQENFLKIDRKYMSKWREFGLRVALRCTICASVTIVAMFVPYFSELMALVGALANCMIVFLLPVAFHYRLYGVKNRPLSQNITAGLVVLLGLFGLCAGTFFASKDLITAIQTGKSSASH